MYLGWDRTHPGISNGVREMSDLGPSGNNMYYSYYARQVVHHIGGAPWQRWNEKMRDGLLKKRAK